MKNLVRGGVILAVLSLFAVFIYAHTDNGSTLAIANDSQATIEDVILDDNNLDTNNNSNKSSDTKKLVSSAAKKLVKTTASVKSTAAGASRGAFSATAYCLSGRTAMGHGVRRGLIAADPRVLKLGSKVVIDAGAWSGTYLVSDTGGAIRGNKIDIWVPNCGEARKFGRRTVRVSSAQ